MLIWRKTLPRSITTVPDDHFDSLLSSWRKMWLLIFPLQVLQFHGEICFLLYVIWVVFTKLIGTQKSFQFIKRSKVTFPHWRMRIFLKKRLTFANFFMIAWTSQRFVRKKQNSLKYSHIIWNRKMIRQSKYATEYHRVSRFHFSASASQFNGDSPLITILSFESGNKFWIRNLLFQYKLATHQQLRDKNSHYLSTSFFLHY